MGAMRSSLIPFWAETMTPEGVRWGRTKWVSPDGVVGLHTQEDRVEGLEDVTCLAQVHRFCLDRELLVQGRDVEPFAADCLDVGGPWVDERHVVARPGKVAADDSADGADAQYRNPVEHFFS